jgi:DNA-binding MarR family transcriptional regulator
VDYEGELAPGTAVRLTERGIAQGAEWRVSYDAACAEFAAPLDEDERQQLVDLLFKLRG